MRIGRSRRGEIALADYEDLADVQARIRVRRGDVVLTNVQPRLPMFVNEQRAVEKSLAPGDVVKLGSAAVLLPATSRGYADGRSASFARSLGAAVALLAAARSFAINVSVAQIDSSRLLLAQNVGCTPA